MGAILAKLKKQKSTAEKLESLQEQIEALEEFTNSTQEQKKRVVGGFLTITFSIYIAAIASFYFRQNPLTWNESIIYLMPLIFFPVVIILLRRVVTWYYQRKLNKNSKKLTALKAEKKKILEQVMDKETYKVAVNILARFGEKPVANTMPKNTLMVLPKMTMQSPISTPNVELSKLMRTSPTSINRTPRAMPLLNSQISKDSPMAREMVRNTTAIQGLHKRTPFPIVNPYAKSAFDRLVDTIIGDGPHDRFAMICKECYGHNGMALKDDFEYSSFRCAYCNCFNSARKTRPTAPKLSVQPPNTMFSAESSQSLNIHNIESSDSDLIESADELPSSTNEACPIRKRIDRSLDNIDYTIANNYYYSSDNNIEDNDQDDENDDEIKNMSWLTSAERATSVECNASHDTLTNNGITYTDIEKKEHNNEVLPVETKMENLMGTFTTLSL